MAFVLNPGNFAGSKGLRYAVIVFEMRIFCEAEIRALYFESVAHYGGYIGLYCNLWGGAVATLVYPHRCKSLFY